MISMQPCVGVDASILLLSMQGASIAMVKNSVAPKAQLQSLDLQTTQVCRKPAKKQSSRRKKHFHSITYQPSSVVTCDVYHHAE